MPFGNDTSPLQIGNQYSTKKRTTNVINEKHTLFYSLQDNSSSLSTKTKGSTVHESATLPMNIVSTTDSSFVSDSVPENREVSFTDKSNTEDEGNLDEETNGPDNVAGDNISELTSTSNDFFNTKYSNLSRTSILPRATSSGSNTVSSSGKVSSSAHNEISLLYTSVLRKNVTESSEIPVDTSGVSTVKPIENGVFPTGKLYESVSYLQNNTTTFKATPIDTNFTITENAVIVSAKSERNETTSLKTDIIFSAGERGTIMTSSPKDNSIPSVAVEVETVTSASESDIFNENFTITSDNNVLLNMTEGTTTYKTSNNPTFLQGISSAQPEKSNIPSYSTHNENRYGSRATTAARTTFKNENNTLPFTLQDKSSIYTFNLSTASTTTPDDTAAPQTLLGTYFQTSIVQNNKSIASAASSGRTSNLPVTVKEDSSVSSVILKDVNTTFPTVNDTNTQGDSFTETSTEQSGMSTTASTVQDYSTTGYNMISPRDLSSYSTTKDDNKNFLPTSSSDLFRTLFSTAQDNVLFRSSTETEYISKSTEMKILSTSKTVKEASVDIDFSYNTGGLSTDVPINSDYGLTSEHSYSVHSDMSGNLNTLYTDAPGQTNYVKISADQSTESSTASDVLVESLNATDAYVSETASKHTSPLNEIEIDGVRGVSAVSGVSQNTTPIYITDLNGTSNIPNKTLTENLTATKQIRFTSKANILSSDVSVSDRKSTDGSDIDTATTSMQNVSVDEDFIGQTLEPFKNSSSISARVPAETRAALFTKSDDKSTSSYSIGDLSTFSDNTLADKNTSDFAKFSFDVSTGTITTNSAVDVTRGSQNNSAGNSTIPHTYKEKNSKVLNVTNDTSIKVSTETMRINVSSVAEDSMTSSDALTSGSMHTYTTNTQNGTGTTTSNYETQTGSLPSFSTSKPTIIMESNTKFPSSKIYSYINEVTSKNRGITTSTSTSVDIIENRTNLTASSSNTSNDTNEKTVLTTMDTVSSSKPYNVSNTLTDDRSIVSSTFQGNSEKTTEMLDSSITLFTHLANTTIISSTADNIKSITTSQSPNVFFTSTKNDTGTTSTVTVNISRTSDEKSTTTSTTTTGIMYTLNENNNLSLTVTKNSQTAGLKSETNDSSLYTEIPTDKKDIQANVTNETVSSTLDGNIRTVSSTMAVEINASNIEIISTGANKESNAFSESLKNITAPFISTSRKAALENDSILFYTKKENTDTDSLYDVTESSSLFSKETDDSTTPLVTSTRDSRPVSMSVSNETNSSVVTVAYKISSLPHTVKDDAYKAHGDDAFEGSSSNVKSSIPSSQTDANTVSTVPTFTNRSVTENINTTSAMNTDDPASEYVAFVYYTTYPTGTNVEYTKTASTVAVRDTDTIANANNSVSRTVTDSTSISTDKTSSLDLLVSSDTSALFSNVEHSTASVPTAKPESSVNITEGTSTVSPTIADEIISNTMTITVESNSSSTMREKTAGLTPEISSVKSNVSPSKSAETTAASLIGADDTSSIISMPVTEYISTVKPDSSATNITSLIITDDTITTDQTTPIIAYNSRFHVLNTTLSTGATSSTTDGASTTPDYNKKLSHSELTAVTDLDETIRTSDVDDSSSASVTIPEAAITTNKVDSAYTSMIVNTDDSMTKFTPEVEVTTMFVTTIPSTVPEIMTSAHDACSVDGLCPYRSTCVSRPAGYDCICTDGFVKQDDHCIDINECDGSPCGPNSFCVNTDGSYRCDCLQGFAETDGLCLDVNECFGDVCMDDATCTNTEGSYECTCNAGFRQIQNLCIDIDECLEEETVCPENSICVNNNPGFECNCRDGYLNLYGICEDVDECLAADVCPLNSACNNTAGSYFCSCFHGYRLAADECLDVDECLTDACSMNAVCQNTPGSFYCQCIQGFALQETGECSDFDECQIAGSCNDHEECTNTAGSYHCTCKDGFHRNKTNGECTDINECVNYPCPAHSDCVNSLGSFMCNCQYGYYKTSASTCTESKVFSGSLHIISSNNNDVHLQEMSAVELDEMAHTVEAAVISCLMESSHHFYGIEVTSLTEGSVIMNISLFFPSNTSYTAGELTNVFTSNLTYWNQYLLEVVSVVIEDMDECSDPDFNDCSEFADCTNLPGTYECTCWSGYLDISVNRQGSICAVIDINNQDPVKGVKLIQTEQAYPVGSMATLMVAMERGSHVTYTIEFGDGELSQVISTEVLSFQHLQEINHEYMFPGNFTLTVNVSNSISTEVIATVVVVQPELTDLYMEVTDLDPLFSGNVRFNISTEKEYKNVYFHWNFGDSSHMLIYEDTFYEMVSISHIFNIGVFDIQVNVSNLVSSVSLKKSVISEEVISGVKVSVEDFTIMPGEYFIFNVFAETGSNIYLELDYGNGASDVISKNNSRRGSTEFAIQKLFSVPDEIIVSVKLSNNISEWFDTIGPVYLQNPVKKLKIRMNEIIPSPPNEIHLEIVYQETSLPPTSVTCEVIVNDTWTVLESVQELTKANPLVVHVETDGAVFGWTEVTVNCSNRLSYQFMETGTYIQAVISDVEIHADKTSVAVGEMVNFGFHIGVGSNVEYTYWFGIGQNYSGTVRATLIRNKTISADFIFGQSGKYDVTFVAKNNVSSTVAFKTVWVLEKVSGLAVARYYVQSSKYNILNYGHGEDTNIFPVQRPVLFSSLVVTGNNIKYRWRFGDGNETVTEQGNIEHRYKMEGVYRITVTAMNDLYQQNRSLVIVMHEIVMPLKLSNNGPMKSYQTMEFILELTYSGTNTCFMWDMGDGSPQVVMGFANCTLQNSSGITNEVIERSTTLTYSHRYTKEGLYTVNVSAFNDVSMATVSSLVVVSGISCFYPVVSFIGGRQTVEMPVKKLVSDLIVLECTAVINCEATSGPMYSWNIQKVVEGDNYLNHILQPYNIDIAHVDNLKIYFQPKMLDVGLYRISLNVSMIGVPGLYSEEYTYLRVDASPLVVKIKGGNARQVSFNKNFILDGLTGSFDPDSYTKSHLQFEWWCRRIDEDFAESLPDDIIMETADSAVNTDDEGKGCFGTGIGRLPFTDGVIELSSLLLRPNSANVFRLLVKDGTREAMFEQVVYVVEGDSPDFHISCVANCKAKMNPSSELNVQSVCESCQALDKIEYAWSLYLYSDNNRMLQRLEDLTSTDTASAGLAVKPGMLIGGYVYTLRLDMKVYGYTASFTEYTFETNLPPYGGNCSINPQTGYALNTLFRIQCMGWMNPGEEHFQGEGLLYRFWTRVRGGSNIQLLYYGTDPFTAPSKFPLGKEEMDYKHDIVVRISNAIGEYVETTLEVQVKARPQQDMDEVRAMASDDSGLLFEMKKAGQDQEYKQLIVAIASVLNKELSEMRHVEEIVETSVESLINQELETETVEAELDNTEDKQKNTQIRTSIVHHLAETDHVTLDSLQQTALCFKVITEQRDELSEQTQETAVKAITHLTDEFTKIIEEPSIQTTSDQVLLAAQEMLASAGNVMLAARTETADHLKEMNVKDTENDYDVAVDDSLHETHTDGEAGHSADVQLEMMKAKELITKVFDVKDKIVGSLVKTRTPGQNLTLQTEAFLIHTKREEISKIDKAVLSSKSGTFTLPSSDMLLTNESIHGQFIDVNVVEFSVNPFLWSDSARFINSPVVSLELVDSQGDPIQVKNVSEPINIDISVDTSAVSTEHVQAKLSKNKEMEHHAVKVRSHQSDLHIFVHPENESTQLEVYLRHDALPTLQKYDLLGILPHEVTDVDNVTGLSNDTSLELAYTVVIPTDVIQEHGIGWWYVGIKIHDVGTNDTSADDIEEDLSVYYDLEETPSVTFNYTISFVTSGCYFWDVIEETWSTMGCQVSPLSNTKFTRCVCNHLTSFGSEFFVPPNQITFDTVFINMEERLRNNHAVLAMLCTVFVLYVVGIIWAWRQDKKDLQKWGVLPLCDNILTDTYFYEVTVFTGMRRGAGTRSNVSFVLAGDKADTGVRQLRDIKGVKTFDRGSINKFILSVDENLGPLSYLRVWHDNSGTGKLQGWYLSKLVVRELQGQEQVYVFLCNRWLAVEEDDGMVDRLLPVAAHEDLSKFGNIFFSDTRKRLTDSHLWISVFARPNKSNYSRVQRLSCLLSLLMMSMLASAMFYQAEENAKSGQGYRLGPFKFTTHEMYISLVTSLIVLPVNILIDQLFRRSKPKKNVKEKAFSEDRPFSALSRFSVRFTDLFRVHSRTQVTPIQANEDEKESELYQKENTETSHSVHTGPLSNYQPVDTDTPLPNVFVKLHGKANPPNSLEARHHYTPAPPLHLKSALKQSKEFDIRKSQVTLFAAENIDGRHVQLSVNESKNSSPTHTGYLTPYISSSVENSPNISPRFTDVKSPTETIFSFDSSVEEVEDITLKSPERTTKTVKKFLLPHWCVYVAWCLVFLSTTVSATVTFLYSMEWGKEKSIAWLTSMLLTIVESVSLIQPTKIIVLAIFAAAILRKTEDEVEKEESINNILPAQPDEISSQLTPCNTKRAKHFVAPPNPKKLASVREQRLKEIKMFRVVQEIVFYMFYLVILILVASHNRDPNSYRMKQMLMNVISPKQNLSRIYNIKDFWHWMDNILVPNLYVSHDWNGDIMADDTRLISTQTSYRVGPVRLRQHRVNPDICDRPRQIVPYIEKCSFDWSQGHDSTDSYHDGWAREPVSDVKVKYNYPWAYKSTMDVDGVPYAGEIGVYGGGGYIADLIGGKDHVTQKTDILQGQNWIDKLTRILIVEFTIYNPNINLFTTTLISFEMPTTGVILKHVQIYTFRLFSYLGGFGIFVILCELCALGCVIYFIGLELKQIKRDGRGHFVSFWNCLQFVTLLTSVTCVIMYLLRHAMTSVAVETVTKLKDKFYNFQRIAVWDEVFQILLAFAIFSSILKLIHILRFNRRMSMLARTLKLSARELSAFSLVFGIVLLAFVGSGHLMFGAGVRGFKTVVQGFETLLSFSLGSYDFQGIIEHYRIVGPIYFVFFFTFVMFVLMNMFVTILNEAFTVVHKDVSRQKNEYEILEFISQHFKKWIGFDMHKIFTSVKLRYFQGDKNFDAAEVNYTLDDLESRLDLMLTSVDAMCKGYLPMEDFDDLDDCDWLPCNRFFE